MSMTNQICITCTQRDTCQYYCPNRTICARVMTEQEMQFELIKSQEKVNALRQEVAAMNKEYEYWRQVHINTAIRLTCVLSEKMLGAGYSEKQIVKQAIELANVLVEELKRNEDTYAECHKLDAINTASVCENMTKIQKELQNKDGSST